MKYEYQDVEPERYEFTEPPRYRFSLSRRAFVQSVGAGILITGFVDLSAFGQQRGDDDNGARAIGGRFHIDKNGRVTAFTGKVEVGQGSRTQLTQAAAEELNVPVSQIDLVMADTSLVPNDGGTYGSQTTPRTVPLMRQAAAAARELLIELACSGWNAPVDGASMTDGTITYSTGKKITLAELASSGDAVTKAFREGSTEGAELSVPADWTVLGKTAAPVNGRNVVTGAHQYTSDIKRPGMLYGKVLRAPAYNAELVDVDSNAAEAIEGVVVVRDGSFVACAAPTSAQAHKGITALASSAKWTTKPHPSSDELHDYLKQNVREGTGRQRSREQVSGDVDAALAASKNVVRAEYRIPYIQHAPMEPRAAVAEFEGDSLTVWTGTQRPFDVRGEVAEALGIPESKVRLIVPDTGGGFGGKHSGDAAVEGARIAQSAKRPVAVHWTREEEFTWAYFRPAGVVEIEAALDDAGKVVAWDFTNYNSGGSGIDCPYAFTNVRTRFRNCDSPLRQGSYRALASTFNNFAREAFIDQLAAKAGADPVAFRLQYLEEPRLKAVLEAAAQKFEFAAKRSAPAANTGYGIACGTEKGSFVATAAEVAIDPAAKSYTIKRVCVAFECGAIHNPQNLQAQVEGGVVMGLGAVLHEEMKFKDGKILNPRFKDYEVPRFVDVPPIETVVVNRPDLPSVGAGETPIIGIAPAVANALAQATGKSLVELPARLPVIR